MKKFLAENGRPDRPVPCPRCHSLNTKFCYFNNYNVKQPRHFCRECQRYWTAGGSLRNVPIGAGRRKHKIASAISSKAHGSATATFLQSDVNECAYISCIKPYNSIPLKQLVSCTSNGSILQEVNSLLGMQSNDVLPDSGLKKQGFSQVLQKPTVNADSNMSMVSQGPGSTIRVLTSGPCDTDSSQQLGFAEILQKHSRNIAVEAKAINEHGPDTSTTSYKHEETEQDKVSEADHDDACSKNESALQLSHTSNTSQLYPSDSEMPGDLSETMQMTERGKLTCCASTKVAPCASLASTITNGSGPATDNLPSASKPVGLESTPAFWGPFMWPWLWPFVVNGANAAQVDPSFAAGIGALAASVVPRADQLASNASHCDTTCTSALGPSLPHWPYAWNPLPWGSPWGMAWNVSNVGHSHLLQAPAKEKQGLLCIPKTLRMDHPDEAAYSSILNTLGVTGLSQSPAGLLNTFQPKADVFQPKTATPKAVEQSELHRHRLPHLNPAAEARSVAFQEGS